MHFIIKFVTNQAYVTTQALGNLLLGSAKGTQTTFKAFGVFSPVLVRTAGLWYLYVWYMRATVT
jgi:hypothetical protein